LSQVGGNTTGRRGQTGRRVQTWFSVLARSPGSISGGHLPLKLRAPRRPTRWSISDSEPRRERESDRHHRAL
jgi:hypothetical protein